MGARKVAAILDDSPSLLALAAVARRTAELQRLYVEAVPAELSKASRVGWARAGELFIAAGNGAVAAKLRQIAPRLLSRFRQQGHEFKTMRIEVQVAVSRPAAPQASPKTLSEAAFAALRRAANEQPESALKAALTRLARAERRPQSARSKT
jgi:hypothetical protein